MGSMFSGNRSSKEEVELVMNKAKEIVSEYPVVVFSKTYCGYCQRVKQVLTQLGATFKVLELDEMNAEEEDISLEAMEPVKGHATTHCFEAGTDP
ncbi:hypothetical protein F2Q70_00000523 [Brassica cretica]|uniref:Glutaredoxin domain-containing protein n=1 Tax=Brassica cretica TaxID=69181 RepID=A0A8S9IUN1_BRACR|nr:hypothetical protein F2Q70_00000523 [Brassica cretica]